MLDMKRAERLKYLQDLFESNDSKILPELSASINSLFDDWKSLKAQEPNQRNLSDAAFTSTDEARVSLEIVWTRE